MAIKKFDLKQWLPVNLYSIVPANREEASSPL